MWFFFTLFVSILMLNLLIAMMATTFERIADQQKEEWALQVRGRVGARVRVGVRVGVRVEVRVRARGRFASPRARHRPVLYLPTPVHLCRTTGKHKA